MLNRSVHSIRYAGQFLPNPRGQNLGIGIFASVRHASTRRTPTCGPFHAPGTNSGTLVRHQVDSSLSTVSVPVNSLAIILFSHAFCFACAGFSISLPSRIGSGFDLTGSCDACVAVRYLPEQVGEGQIVQQFGLVVCVRTRSCVIGHASVVWFATLYRHTLLISGLPLTAVGSLPAFGLRTKVDGFRLFFISVC